MFSYSVIIFLLLKSDSFRFRLLTFDSQGSKDKSSKAVSGHDATGENINQESGSTPAPKIPKSGPKVPGGQCQGNKAGQGPLPANDAPHRFWAYLNNYCQAANDDQVEVGR